TVRPRTRTPARRRSSPWPRTLPSIRASPPDGSVLLPEQRQLAPEAREVVEVGPADEAQHRVGDRAELLRHVVLVVGRRRERLDRLGAVPRDDVGDEAAPLVAHLPRRLHVRGRRPRVFFQWLSYRLPVRELVVEAAGAEVGDERAHEL